MQADAQRNDHENGPGFEPNSVFGTLVVAMVLCLICSLVVSTAAVALKPIQDVNRENRMRRNVLVAAGIWDEERHTNADIPELFKQIQTVLVNLPTTPDDDATGDVSAGTMNDRIDPANYNPRKAARDPADSITISAEGDVANIKRREKLGKVYIAKDEAGNLETIVLPIYGNGLWSTLYGFIALEPDARTVKGITFYEHAETPGLGGEVENPSWTAKWNGKIALDENGKPILEVTKPGYANAPNEIDGLSGATITSNGVQAMVRYWLGPDAFGPFLNRIRTGELKFD